MTEEECNQYEYNVEVHVLLLENAENSVKKKETSSSAVVTCI